VLAALIAAGLLPDDGLVPALSVEPTARFAAVLVVPLVMGLAVWQARVTRRATLDALDRAVAAMREMRTREAQLEEANRDLDFLMRMAAGRAGPYTGLMAGRYAIRHLIARGAMGEVYAATDTDSGEDAAIKLLQSNMLGDEQLVMRFLREGEAASQLKGTNVVTIYEVGTIGANGAPYIAMELLRGHDLAWHLRGALPLDEVVALSDQVASALEAARKAGIVHRDLKPQNLFLAQQHAAAPAWKILDFGVSRLAGTSGTLTMDLIVGTPGYMSPEQAAGGKEVTHRSDVFSFGAVLYRALTGQPPFSGPDTPQILYQVVYRSPARPSLLVPGLPADVEIVLAIALAKDPAERFATALEMAEALRAASRGALDPSLRVHAQTLLASLPWGTSLREESEGELELDVDSGA
jgi:serine/threonine-protein kinase